MACQNSSGYNNKLFPNDLIMKAVIGDLLEHYLGPISASVGLIKGFLTEAVTDNTQNRLRNYPELREEVAQVLREKIADFEQDTINHLECLIEAEKAFINTRHPEFKWAENALQQVPSAENDSNGGFAYLRFMTNGFRPGGQGLVYVAFKSGKMIICQDQQSFKVCSLIIYGIRMLFKLIRPRT